MLQIRLNNKGTASEIPAGAKASQGETVTVACPDHLVIADLPVAKSIGTAYPNAKVKIVGRRSRRQVGERVHFCVKCDNPINVYGRLIPCEHVFCFECARDEANCYLCDKRIQKIQTVKLKEGTILICAAPHCLVSFLNKSDFEAHINEKHSDLLQSSITKDDVNESMTKPSSTEVHANPSTPADSSTGRAPARGVFLPKSNPQPNALEEKSSPNQPMEQAQFKQPNLQPKPPQFSQHQNYSPELQQETKAPPVFDRPGPYNHFHNQQSLDKVGSTVDRRDFDQFPGKQQGGSTESSFPTYPMHSHPPPNFMVPVNPNLGLVPPFSYPFSAGGSQLVYTAPYEMARADMASGGFDRSSLLGSKPAPVGSMGFSTMSFEKMQLGVAEGHSRQSDSQGRTALFQSDFGSFPGMVPLQPPLMPPMAGKAFEPPQGSSAADNKDGKGMLMAEQGMLMAEQMPLPPPSPPPHFLQLPQQGNYAHYGDTGRGGQSYGWKNET